ncbi:DNA repair protein XRCC1-like [Asterias amurensis]|uniref:DNA repair protein XRCC1-like n=1 Tax=Asterias amurensis TaxID=7602 RepID=UPI003AB655C9
MPAIKLQYVVSSSSEDTTHKADNLLKPESYRKWKCAEDADRKASVILQFEKASQIHSIDIGNDNSAFVEVLVGHSTSTSSDDYQVVLVTSSFMSPMDSKNGINTNRVRMFGPEKLSKAVLDKKWDRAKVVCSQPFNKLSSYGLSFIKFHSPPEKTEESSSANQSEQQSASKLGMFRLKEDTKSTSLTAGSFFKQRSITKTEPAPLTGAAAVRAAATLAAASLKTSVSTSQSTMAAGPTTTTTTNQVRPSTSSTPKSADKHSDRPQKVTQKRRLSDEDSTPSSRPGDSRTAATRRNNADREEKKTAAPPSKKSRDNEDTSRKKKSSKPFERLMEGVTFVLSGFQNPLRGDLRDKAMEMGAKYQPDWGKGCTHLVCAFANTPKFNQVQGKGKIVTKGWILDSYKKKSLHPWRRYNMVSTSDDSSSYEEESETEDEEDREPNKRRRAPPKKATPNKAMPKAATPKRDTPKDARPVDEDTKEDVAASSMADQRTDPPTAATGSADSVPTEVAAAGDNDDCSTTDIESEDGGNNLNPKASYQDDISSGGDTEDEVRRIQENKKVKAKPSSTDPYDSSTDEEPDSETPDPPVSPPLPTAVPDLPDFFEGNVFFLYGKFEAEERRQLTRLIVAFEGTVEDYMSDQVIFVVTNSDWDDNFDKALSDHPGLAFVRPKWIYNCCEKSKKVPYQPYVIVPS